MIVVWCLQSSQEDPQVTCDSIWKAVEDWLKCKEARDIVIHSCRVAQWDAVLESLERSWKDAQQCIKLQKNYVKGWLLLVGTSGPFRFPICLSLVQQIPTFDSDFIPGQIYLGAGSLRYPKPPIWSAPSLCQLRLGKHADALQELQNGSEPQTDTYFLGIPLQIIKHQGQP